MIAFALTITAGWWLIPGIATAVWLVAMLIPKGRTGTGNDYFGLGAMIDGMLVGLWLIPVLFIWVIYLVLRLWLGIV